MADVARLPRVGILIPSTDTTVEIELPELLAGRATCHFARMKLESVTVEGLTAMEVEALAEAALFADINVDVVLFACTSGTFIYGPEYEADLASRLAAAAGAPVVTTANAMAQALALRGTNVRLRTPYDEALTAAEVGYLSAHGLAVSSTRSLDITVDDEIAAVTADTLRELATGNDDADVIMLSCTNLRTLPLIAEISAATGLPVVTSNTAAAARVIAVLGGEPAISQR